MECEPASRWRSCGAAHSRSDTAREDSRAPCCPTVWVGLAVRRDAAFRPPTPDHAIRNVDPTWVVARNPRRRCSDPRGRRSQRAARAARRGADPGGFASPSPSRRAWRGSGVFKAGWSSIARYSRCPVFTCHRPDSRRRDRHGRAGLLHEPGLRDALIRAAAREGLADLTPIHAETSRSAESARTSIRPVAGSAAAWNRVWERGAPSGEDRLDLGERLRESRGRAIREHASPAARCDPEARKVHPSPSSPMRRTLMPRGRRREMRTRRAPASRLLEGIMGADAAPQGGRWCAG